MRFEGIVNKGRSIVETHRGRKAEREVLLQSDAVAEYIANCPKDEIRFNIGKPPRGLTGDEFMDRVGAYTELALGKLGLRGAAIYDHEASERVTHEFEAIQPGSTMPRGAEGVRVVFSRLVATA